MDLVDDKIRELAKGNPLVSEIKDEKKIQNRHQLWWSVDRLTQSACKLYCDGKMDWDEVIDNLSEALEKLKGKEKELESALKEDRKKEGKNIPDML